MPRFFVPESAVSESIVTITGKDAHHLRNVLRIRPGEEITVCAGKDTVYTCTVERTDGDITARITDLQRTASELPCHITLFQCLPKKDRMDWIIQKAVELGVCEIVPVISARTIVRLDEKKAASRVGRWNEIAKNAAEQSGRCIMPSVAFPVSFEKALALSAEYDIKIMPYENAEGMAHTRRVFEETKGKKRAALIIGPEGGFSAQEAAACEQAGFEAVTLGRRILRTETAALAALSMLVYCIEEQAQEKDAGIS